MMCAFCERLQGEVTKLVQRDLKEQHAQLTAYAEQRLVDDELARLASRLIEMESIYT